MRIEQTFTIAATPEAVFDYMTDPSNLQAWQPSKTRVEVVSDGSPRQGFRVREWTKPPGSKEFEQLVEFTEFERPSRLHVHIVEGPFPVDGNWSLAETAEGTAVHFIAEGRLSGVMGVIEPIAGRMMGRQFKKYHELLRRNVESTPT